MDKFNVQLQSIDSVKAFVTAANIMGCEIDVLSDRYLVDAKSIMGLFSLDLAKPVTVQVHGTPQEQDRFYHEVEALVVKG